MKRQIFKDGREELLAGWRCLRRGLVREEGKRVPVSSSPGSPRRSQKRPERFDSSPARGQINLVKDQINLVSTKPTSLRTKSTSLRTGLFRGKGMETHHTLPPGKEHTAPARDGGPLRGTWIPPNFIHSADIYKAPTVCWALHPVREGLWLEGKEMMRPVHTHPNDPLSPWMFLSLLPFLSEINIIF